MSENTEKVWVQGPAGVVVSLVIGVEIEKAEFDKRIKNGELTIVDSPEKPAAVKKPAAKKSDSAE